MTATIDPRTPWRETHISRIHRIDDRVYKVKKPVTFPFLDYGTLERRHACCRAEVELNRRFAPDVYVSVVALVPDGDVLAVAAEEDPRAVEYAVEMRRFDESNTLAARLAQVSEAELAAVGGAVAGF